MKNKIAELKAQLSKEGVGRDRASSVTSEKEDKSSFVSDSSCICKHEPIRQAVVAMYICNLDFVFARKH